MDKCAHHDDLEEKVSTLGDLSRDLHHYNERNEEATREIKSKLETMQKSITELCIILPSAYVAKTDFENFRNVHEAQIVNVYSTIDKKNSEGEDRLWRIVMAASSVTGIVVGIIVGVITKII